jgi:hypothetical protein
MAEDRFAVVEFLNEHSVSVVPETWLEKKNDVSLIIIPKFLFLIYVGLNNSAF